MRTLDEFTQEHNQITESMMYDDMIQKLQEAKEAGKPIDEGLFGAIVGGIAGITIAPSVMKAICKILGVDVLLIGEVSSYVPARTELTLTSTRRTESRPVYTQDVMQLPDGTYVGYTRNVGAEYTHTTEVRPTEYTINARVGIIAKLVDVETAEIVWIGSSDASSASALDAADTVARRLVKSFTKELAKLQEE